MTDTHPGRAGLQYVWDNYHIPTLEGLVKLRQVKNLVAAQDARIAELEAQVARLRAHVDLRNTLLEVAIHNKEPRSFAQEGARLSGSAKIKSLADLPIRKPTPEGE